MTRNAHQLVQNLAQQLLPVYEELPVATSNAWWIIEALTKKTKANLIRDSYFELTQDQQQTLTSWLHDILHNQKPLQYIIGEVSFLQLDLTIKPPILIPRPETEAWCDQLIVQLKTSNQYPRMILDLCTGSGCIGLALAQAFPHSTVYATDINPHALDLARYNAQRNGLQNIIFIESDLFQAIPAELSFDLIVSNPPYIAQSEWQQLEPSVKLWEDHNALVAQDHGLALIKKIIAQAPDFLSPAAQVWIEIGYQQGTIVADFFKKRGFTEVNILSDLQNHDRVVHGKVINQITATTAART